METISSSEAFRLAREVSQVPGLTFTIAFFPYSRAKKIASDKLTVKETCRIRPQLPDDRFSIDSDNFFLYTDQHGNPKSCYRILVRFMGFPQDDYKLRKVVHL